ncbi:MAG: IS91 family transposase [Alphaproteobacteria bacterium]
MADFLNMWWDDYCKNPKEFIQPEVYKAVNAIRVCRTAALGIDYYACPDCGEISEVRHSCKNRFCPTCSWKDTIKWSEAIKSKMLNIAHRHSVFTLPHKLNPLIKKNKKAMLNILSRISAEVYKSWFKVKFNVKIGIVSVIHTFGERKNAHYHIHQIVSWGGTDFKTGELIEFKGKEKEYINYNHIKKEFRRQYVDELDELFKNNDLDHNFADEEEFKKFKRELHRTKWQFHLEDPMETPAIVIRYIGRYSKRACLSEYKITNIEGQFISFKYKDYRDRENPNDPKSPAKEKQLRLHYNKFFPLLLQHVPPPYFRMVRYYGLYARFNKIPEQYCAKEDEQLLETIEAEYETSPDNPKFCGACTKAKVYINTLIDTRSKKNRTETFDIKKHSHRYYQKVIIKQDEKNLKKAA